MSTASAPLEVDGANESLDERRLATVSSQATSVRWQIIATATVIVALVGSAVPAEVAVGWWLLAVGLREWRARALQALVRDKGRPIQQRLHLLVGWNAALGIANGAAAGFMAWLDPTYDALLTMILVSWAAGAVSTSAPMLRAYTVYSVCVFVPLIVMWLLPPSALGVAVAALIAMFARVQHRFARQNAEVFEASFRIRMENLALVDLLAQARDAAEAANRAKTRFLAAASHDLRQPLHALGLHSALLARQPQAQDAAAIAAAISTSIESLGKLLDSLLDISKLDAGVVEIESHPIRLQRLLSHIVNTLGPLARDKGLLLRYDCPGDAIVQTDPLLLERLLRNLVDNAIKYTDDGSVSITVAADGDDFEVAVHDTGRGIDPALQARVFEEFFQIGGPAQAPRSGLGLGLAIVRRLAGVLGMGLSLQSQPGAGSSFTLRMPRRPGPSADSVDAPAPQPSLRGLSVLLVDDEATVREAMDRVLRHFGCHPLLAGSTDEALQRAQEHFPDIVLADLRLGADDSGIDAIARLRALRPELPALLISADTDAQPLRAAAEHGLRLLHKPVGLEPLRVAIVVALGAKAPMPASAEEGAST